MIMGQSSPGNKPNFTHFVTYVRKEIDFASKFVVALAINYLDRLEERSQARRVGQETYYDIVISILQPPLLKQFDPKVEQDKLTFFQPGVAPWVDVTRSYDGLEFGVAQHRW